MAVGQKHLVGTDLVAGETWNPAETNYATITWLAVSPENPAVPTTWILTIAGIDGGSKALTIKNQSLTLPENHSLSTGSIISIACTLGKINVVAYT